MPILTIVDTVAIQHYVFGSNRLKESVGASELVKQVTDQFVFSSLAQFGHNIKAVDERGAITFTGQKLEDGNIQAELIYAGGGNAVLLFTELPEAKLFTRALSEKLITTAPGIELAVIHHPFEWTEILGGQKSGVMYEAFIALENLKRSQSQHRPLAGLGVTAVCDSTGQVATTVDQAGGRLISAETAAKLEAVSAANAVFKRNLANSPYQLPLDFDDMGRSKGESSYIAVVHIDGNGMGEKVQQLGADHAKGTDNRAFLEALRRFSQDVFTASWAAFDALFTEMLRSLRFVDGLQPGFVPFRPLIVGGDDLTFVCDGRLALTLSEFYLRQFEAAMATSGNPYLKSSHACAGIAVVKSHYPFARAYDIAEMLCKKAKGWVKEKKQTGGTDFSALDWHFAPGGLMGGLDTIRQREYGLFGGDSLLMRPLALTAANDNWRHWPNFNTLVSGFRKDWAQGRNKIKLLREALRQGPEGYKQFISAYGKDTLPKFESPYLNAFDNGFIDNCCIHFDAVEAMDFFIPLYSDQGGEA